MRSGHTVTLHSAPNADAFYLAMGFRPTGPKQQQDGIVFTPMAKKF
jgi:predicted GNAT family N-acyltransferase